MRVTLPSGRVEELYFSDPKFHGHMIDVLIFVKQDGWLERTHRGTITKVDGHPCHLSMTIGESFVREQLVEIERKMYRLDTEPPRQPPVALKTRRAAQKNGKGDGQGKTVPRRGHLVLALTEVQVGDVLCKQTQTGARFLNTYAGWTVSSHKKRKSSGTIKLIDVHGNHDVVSYAGRDITSTVQVLRG